MFEYNWSQHNDDRLRRAEAWLERSREDGTPDIERFIFLWIAFNSAYGDEDSIRDRNQTEVFKVFLGNIVKKDKPRERLFRLVWQEFKGPIRDLLNNAYVNEEFWRYVRGKGKKKYFKNLNKSLEKSMEQPSTEDLKEVLFEMFNRLYTLRNQVFHGGVTHPTGYGGPQIRDSVKIMSKLVPEIVETMLEDIKEDPNSRLWGRVSYPRIDQNSQLGKKEFSGAPAID
ncbi:MAG: HEPN domain-containing protein [Gammaproteobacteria bacterium]|nr:HEPN domain-containing protein [Gammaproteobacteria bacterium]